MEKEPPIRVGDRIVYFGDQPCRGTVRWLGNIEDISPRITAGIELEEPSGTNDGVWAGRSLFKCRKNHGVFIDLAGLIKEDDFGNGDNNDYGEEGIYEQLAAATNVAEIQPEFESRELFSQLKRAISNGQPDEAADLASRLARLYSNNDDSNQKNQTEKHVEQKLDQRRKPEVDGKVKNTVIPELCLNVQVEMKDSDGAEFQVLVPNNFTIQMLMEKVEKDFGYETNRQRWFFNDDMVTNCDESVREQYCSNPVLYVREKVLYSGAQKISVEGNANAKKTSSKTVDVQKANAELVEKPDSNAGWECMACTFVNEPTRPGCLICSSSRPEDYVVKSELEETYKKACEKAERDFLEKFDREMLNNYQKYVELDERELIPNNETFECKVCLNDIEPGVGIQLRECLHNFCRDCIRGTIVNSEDIPIQCPYTDHDYNCQSVLQDREVANILSKEELQKYHSRCWAKAAGGIPNSYHCKTPDCPGWCVYEYGAREFLCPICRHTSCITCQVIHEGKNCKEYQDDLKLNSQNNEDARKTQEKIAEMIAAGTAMDCPGCGIVIMKTEGCDGMICSHCRIEICWATKGRRWGLKGTGDFSGGCQCRAPPAHALCHPNCRNCH